MSAIAPPIQSTAASPKKLLVVYLPAVRLRSDVETKRILGLDPRSEAGPDAYSGDLTAKTYARLETLARTVVGAGYVAIADATFLRRDQRKRFQDLAASLNVPFVIIDCDAPVKVLRQRIIDRAAQEDNVSDAGLAVLRLQLGSREPLSDEEVRLSLPVRPDRPLDRERLLNLLTG